MGFAGKKLITAVWAVKAVLATQTLDTLRHNVLLRVSNLLMIDSRAEASCY